MEVLKNGEKMRLSSKILFLVSIFSLVLAAEAFALPMVANDSVKMDYNGEVPYTMTDLKNNTVYHSFCLESENFFTPGTTYDVMSVGDYATGGGGGTVAGLGDKVADETKWLYAAFISNVFGNANDIAQKVQNAIWWLEEEDDGIESDWNYFNNNFDFFNASDAGWNIVAVNISIDGIEDNQSQLIGVAPVPEPATMLLFGAGLLGLAGSRIRRKK